MKSITLVLVLSLFSCLLFSQVAEYKVGASKVSLEPDNSVFSLTLGGYAAPYDGRFSISWKEQEILPDIISITGNDKYLYMVTASGKLIQKGVDAGSSLVTLGDAGGIKKIAVLKNKLYGISTEGHLFESNVKKIAWKQTGNFEGIQAVCASGEKLFIIDKANMLRETVHEKGIQSWKSLGNCQPALSITVYKDRVYMLSGTHILYKRDDSAVGTPWTKIGYKNNQTYTIDIKQIAMANKRFYAVDENNKLYIAEHSTRNDLYATAIAINSGKKTVVMVGLDLVGFDYSLGKLIKDEVKKKKGIPADAIIINASHTHFSPVSQAWSTWAEYAQKPDSIYLRDIVLKNTLEAIYQALNNMKKSTISFGRTESVIGANRSLSGEDALYDPTVDILKMESTDKNNKNIFFMASCHPVFNNSGDEAYTISANFPGVAKKIIEDHGFNHASFFQGCGGDINPLDGDNVKTGTKLATDVLEALKMPMQKVSGDISYALDSVLIPVSPWSKEKVEGFKSENTGKEGDLYAERNVRWADMMLSYYKNNNMPKYLPVYIQTINIGDWKLVGLSREAVTEYCLSIRGIWPGKNVSVAAYCNDISSYLPSETHAKAHNYEGYDSSIWYGLPDFFPENTLEIIVNHIEESDH